MILVSGVQGKGAPWFMLWSCKKLLDEFPEKGIILIDLNKEFIGYFQDRCTGVTILTYAPSKPSLLDQAKEHPSRFYILDDQAGGFRKNELYDELCKVLVWMGTRMDTHLFLNTCYTKDGVAYIEKFEKFCREKSLPLSMGVSPFRADMILDEFKGMEESKE